MTALLDVKINPIGNVQHILYFIFIFLQLGFFSIRIRDSKPHDFLTKETHELQCKIIELPSGDKKWNKGVAQIQQIFIKNEKSFTSKQKLLFYTDKKTSNQLGQGDIILVKSQIQKINNKGNPGEFNASYYWGSKDTYYLSFFTHSDFSVILDSKDRIKVQLKAEF